MKKLVYFARHRIPVGHFSRPFQEMEGRQPARNTWLLHVYTCPRGNQGQKHSIWSRTWKMPGNILNKMRNISGPIRVRFAKDTGDEKEITHVDDEKKPGAIPANRRSTNSLVSGVCFVCTTETKTDKKQYKQLKRWWRNNQDDYPSH